MIAGGTTSGPYEVSQVVGPVLTLLASVYWAASRRNLLGAVLGTTAGLTVAAYYDWSDGAWGMFTMGVTMVMMGSRSVTTAVPL